MEKKIIFLGLFLLTLTGLANAQKSNAILFAENGEKFQVVLNGVLQNSNPETNVKLTDLPADHYKCRIIFADAKLGYVDFNMFFEEQGNEVTWNIKKNNKGEYVTRWVSSVEISQAPEPTPAQSVIVYTTVPAATTTSTTIQQTHTSGGKSDDINFNMGINAGGEGANISIHASGLDGGGQSVQQTTTTTTTHTVTTTNAPPPPHHSPEPVPVIVYVPGYSGKIGCPIPLNPSEFSEMKESIRSKDFENTKLTIAKQIIENNCLTCAQVKEILGLFDFENTRLEYAKYAYQRTYDVSNYYKINDAFEFESSVDDLNKYINAHK
jgi:hypothetical protein